MHKKLVAYLRVSSIGQIDNTSLSTQLEKIQEYCRFKGHELIPTATGEPAYQDTESGKNMSRDGFEQAIKHVFEGGADGIIVWSLDRFARKALRGWQIIADLDEAGKDLVVVNRDLDTTGPTGKLIRNILLAVAEYELALLHERWSSGRAAKKAAGGYYAGQPRYGWRSVGGSLEPVASEQWTIKVLRRFESLGVSSYKSAKHLNRHERHVTKHGGTWTPKTVERILERDGNESNGYALRSIEGGKGSEARKCS